MPWIQQIPLERATGNLKTQFEKAIGRAGRIFNIVHIMSQNPEAMQASMQLYETLMHGESPLSRYQRELLATVVAAELECPY